MIPLDTFTPTPIVTPFVPPLDDAYQALTMRAPGGVAIGDGSQGREVQFWSVSYLAGVISVAPASGTVAFTLPVDGVLSLSLAFDANMALVLGYMKADGAYVYYFDSTTNAYETLAVSGATSCSIAVDKTDAFFSGSSDVIFAYVLAGEFCYRQQRDRYAIEHQKGPVPGPILRVGPSLGNRFQAQFLSSAPPPPAPAPAPAVPSYTASGAVAPSFYSASTLSGTTQQINFGTATNSPTGFDVQFTQDGAAYLLPLSNVTVAYLGTSDANAGHVLGAIVTPRNASGAGAAYTITGFTVTSASPAPAPAPAPAPSPAMATLAAALGRGINLGNMLEAPLEGDWGPAFVDGWAAIIKTAGFTTVRLPVRFSNHAAVTADATLDPTFLARVDHVITTLLAQGLYVVGDFMHHYRQLDGDAVDVHEVSVDPSVVQTRAINIWKQLSAHYASWSASLLYELKNEPHGTLDGGSFDGAPWNVLYPQLLAGLRLNDATRAVLIGPSNYNNADFLANLTPPTDPHVIITVHNYLPVAFTLQGQYGTSYPTPAAWDGDASVFTTALDQAVAFRTSTGYPVFVGEFGTDIAAPEASRVAWTTMAVASMASRGMSWSTWNFDADFAVYDTTANAWDTALLPVLIPPSVTPLPSAFSQLTPGSANGTWGLDAPTDADQAAFPGVASYPEKGVNTSGVVTPGVESTLVVTNISQLPTITNASNGGGVRFGPTTVDGVPAIIKSIRQGDALYYAGNRSGLAYDGFEIRHNVDYWFAFAVKFGTEWVQANSDGGNDRQAIWDTHSVAESSGFNGTLAEISWNGGLAGSYTGKELWMSVPQYDSGDAAWLYNWAANPGGWQRVVVHYRSGTSGPVMDLWIANGAGSYVQLAKAIDPYTGTAWTVTPSWGDPLGGGNGGGLPDFMKFEIYKWTTGFYGTIPSRSMVTSWMYAAAGVNLYAEAVAALAAYAK